MSRGIGLLLTLACLVVFLDVTFFSVLTPLLPGYQSSLALSETEIGVLSGAFAAGALIFALPGGWVAAKTNPRTTIIIGLVGIGIFSPVFGWSDAYVPMVAARFLQGAAGALMWAGALSWVVEAVDDSKRGAALGMVFGVATVGELMGAPLGALAHSLGDEVVFSFVTVAAALGIAFALSIPAPARIDQSLGEVLRIIRRSETMLRRGVLLAVPSAVIGLTIAVGPIRLDDLGVSVFGIAAIFAAGALVQAAAGPLSGRYSDTAGRAKPYIAGTAMLTVILLAFALASAAPAAGLLLVLVSLGVGLTLVPASTAIADDADAGGISQGYAAGIVNAGWGGGQIVGSIAGGALAEWLGFAAPFILCSAVLGFVLIAILSSRRAAGRAIGSGEPGAT